MFKVKRKGSLLIEALVAMAILAQVIIIAFTVMDSTSKIARMTRAKIQCLGYAEDALEKIRNIRDANQNQAALPFDINILDGRVRIIPDVPGSNNFITESTSVEETMQDQNFKRTVNITKTLPDIITVDVTVAAPIGKCEASEQLTNWRKE